MTFSSRMLLCHQITSAWQCGLLCCFLWRKFLCLGKGALELRKRGYYGFGFLSSPDIFPLNLIVVFFYKYWTLCSASSIYSKGQRNKEKLQLDKVLYNVIWENKSHYLRKGALLFLKWERRSGNKDFPPPQHIFSNYPFNVVCSNKFRLKYDFIKSQIGCDVICLVISLQK